MRKRTWWIVVLAIQAVSTVATVYGLAVYFSRDLTIQVKVRGLDVLVCQPDGNAYKNQEQTYELLKTDKYTGKVWIAITKSYDVTSLHIQFNLTATHNGESVEGVTATVQGTYKMIWYHSRDHVWHYHDFDVPVNMDFYGVNPLDLTMMDWKYVERDSMPSSGDQNCLELTFVFDTTGVDPSLTDEDLTVTVTVTITE